ncbi:hypothetical protein JCM15519_20910 [Fundidesulfovibrio butyratiphilus]
MIPAKLVEYIRVTLAVVDNDLTAKNRGKERNQWSKFLDHRFLVFHWQWSEHNRLSINVALRYEQKHTRNK